MKIPLLLALSFILIEPTLVAEGITKEEAIQLAIAKVHQTPAVVLVSTIEPIVAFGPGRYDKENMWVIKLAALTSTVAKEVPYTGPSRGPGSPKPLSPQSYPKYCRVEVCVKKDGSISSYVSLPNEKA